MEEEGLVPGVKPWADGHHGHVEGVEGGAGGEEGGGVDHPYEAWTGG